MILRNGTAGNVSGAQSCKVTNSAVVTNVTTAEKATFILLIYHGLKKSSSICQNN